MGVFSYLGSRFDFSVLGRLKKESKFLFPLLLLLLHRILETDIS